MRRIVITAFAILALLCAASLAQTPLTNESVLKMVKAGLGEEIILPMVQSQPGNYSITPDDLVALKTAGVPDKVIAAMVGKASSAPAPAPAPVPANPTPAPAPVTAPAAVPANLEVGIYYKKDGEWKELLPEVVNWKTGGVMKSIATAGIVKGDVNGNIQGPSSRTKLASPIEIMIYAPEGTAVTEYQLLQLRENKGYREFRTVTGGVLHTSGGATRDLINFEGKKVAPRTFVISLPSVKPGEYGILPPGTTTSSSAGAQLGKMYTFRIVE